MLKQVGCSPETVERSCERVLFSTVREYVLPSVCGVGMLEMRGVLRAGGVLCGGTIRQDTSLVIDGTKPAQLTAVWFAILCTSSESKALFCHVCREFGLGERRCKV